jgi:hypothetical protein
MLASILKDYLSEMSHVLKTQGKCLITFFLQYEESENLIRSGCSNIDFAYRIKGCLTINEAIQKTLLLATKSSF